MERFKSLYGELSGADAAVRALSVEDVRSKISQICGTVWPELQKKFAGYWGEFQFSGIVPKGYSPSNEVLAIMRSAHLSAKIWDSDNAYLFEIQATTQIPNGVILLRHKSPSITEDYKSRLFAEHLPNVRYDGEVYGIKFSADEAGLYNYYTDNLVAKYVSGFSPSDEYWNSEERLVRFQLEKSVLNQKITDFELRLAEP
ncbi:MAG: hypothetical protein ACE5OR_05625 [bacterium]